MKITLATVLTAAYFLLSAAATALPQEEGIAARWDDDCKHGKCDRKKTVTVTKFHKVYITTTEYKPKWKTTTCTETVTKIKFKPKWKTTTCTETVTKFRPKWKTTTCTETVTKYKPKFKTITETVTKFKPKFKTITCTETVTKRKIKWKTKTVCGKHCKKPYPKPDCGPRGCDDDDDEK